MTRKEVIAASHELEKGLGAEEFGSNVVVVYHEDGSKFLLCNAFVKRYDENNWMVVHTEHNGFLVFAIEDISFYSEGQREEMEDGGHDTNCSWAPRF